MHMNKNQNQGLEYQVSLSSKTEHGMEVNQISEMFWFKICGSCVENKRACKGLTFCLFLGHRHVMGSICNKEIIC